MDDIAFSQIFPKDFADYKGMNEVYRTYITNVLPARYVVPTDLIRDVFLGGDGCHSLCAQLTQSADDNSNATIKGTIGSGHERIGDHGRAAQNPPCPCSR